jgi:WD40 repeat protein
LGAQRFRAPSSVHELALSPDEKTVVSFGDELIAWDTATGKARWSAKSDEFGVRTPGASYGMRAIAFTPDSQRFYTPGPGNHLLVWNTMSGEREDLPIDGAMNVAQWMAARGAGYRAIDVSPDGKSLAAGNASGLVIASGDNGTGYQIANRPKEPFDIDAKDRLRFGGHYSYARFAPDSKTLAVVTSDTPQAIRIVAAADGTELRRIELSAWLVRMDFSPDGKRIVATERDSAVRMYDVETAKPLWSHVVELDNPYENYTSAVAISPDGQLVAVCATDYTIRLLDASNGEATASLKGHTWYPWALAFSRDGKTLYSSGWDRAIRRWDVATRKQLELPEGTWGSSVIAASPDGRTLAYEDGWGAIRLVDAASGAQKQKLELPGTRYGELAFSPAGSQLAAGGGEDDDIKVVVWDIASGTVAHQWKWPRGADPHSSINSLAYSPNGKRLAAAVFRQSSATLWDMTSGEQVAKLPHKQIYGLSFTGDDELVSAGWDRAVRFWNADSGTLEQTIDLAPVFPNDQELRMVAVCSSPDAELLATAQLQGKLRVWQSANMALRAEFQFDGRFIDGAICFSPDGLWLAAGGMNGSLAVWDATTGQLVWSRGHHEGYVHEVAFTPDGRRLFSGGADGVAYLWDLRPTEPADDNDPAALWDALDGDDAPAAYRAMWALSDQPAKAVPLVDEKLRPITDIVDSAYVTEGYPEDEKQHIEDLQRLLAEEAPQVMHAVTFRRAVSLLEQIDTPDARQALKDVIVRNPAGDAARVAAAALRRAGLRQHP